MHTKNLLADDRASLLIMQSDVAGDPLGTSRVTMMGRVARAPKEEQAAAREPYLSRHEHAGYWVDFGDFGFYRMEPVDVYYVGGFGVMGWVAAHDYAKASVDPLADEASRLIQTMNADRADDLLRLARASGHAEAEEARMTALDRLGFHLRLRTGDRVQGGRLAFPRPVQNMRDVTQAFEDLIKQARGKA